MKTIGYGRHYPGVLFAAAVALLGGGAAGVFGVCGPFTDVSDATFCPFVLEIFTLGITTGLTPTTYDPASSVSRLQMAAFLSRSVDGILKRGSRRAALDQHWTAQGAQGLGLTTVGGIPQDVRSDGADLWVANYTSETVSRVRANDGKLLETWTGAPSVTGVLVAMGRVFLTGGTSPGRLYRVDPAQPAGAVTTVATDLGSTPIGITFDGARIWTANGGAPASLSIVTPGATLPWTATTISSGFSSAAGALYDGSNVWVTDAGNQRLLKLDSSGLVLQTVTVGLSPQSLTFDGGSLWVPNEGSNSVSVVRASTGAVLTTLTGNGLNGPSAAAFDGQRVLVTNSNGNSVSLWKAADLTPLGAFLTGAGTIPIGATSDGINFWITLEGTNQLARF